MKTLEKFVAAQPPNKNVGEEILNIWDELYDTEMQSIVVQTVSGLSNDETNPVFPYEKIQAVVGQYHGGGEKDQWLTCMWACFDELERRGILNIKLIS